MAHRENEISADVMEEEMDATVEKLIKFENQDQMSWSGLVERFVVEGEPPEAMKDVILVLQEMMEGEVAGKDVVRRVGWIEVMRRELADDPVSGVLQLYGNTVNWRLNTVV